MPNDQGVNGFTDSELEALLNGEKQPENSPPVSEKEGLPNDVAQTKAFAARLRESTEKARHEEREAVAKAFGYASYEEMQNKHRDKVLSESGLDPEQVSPIVEKLVQERMENDPRMKELEKYRQAQIEEFAQKELAQITKLTNGEITTMEQIPKDVLDLWKVRGSLKTAYLELKGEDLLLKARAAQNQGSTAHLKNPSGTAGEPSDKRVLTEQEKKMYKFFNPDMSDDDINKIRYKK